MEAAKQRKKSIMRMDSYYQTEKADSPALTQLEHLAELEIEGKPVETRKTGIICTIGPSCDTLETLIELIQNGMNIARINFSHGSHEQHAQTIARVRQAAIHCGECIAIALDTRGPEIRTGMIHEADDVELIHGDELVLSTNSNYYFTGTSKLIYVDYERLPHYVHTGSRIYIDDGLISLRVREVKDSDVFCVVEQGGRLGHKKAVILSGVHTDLPDVTETDKYDLRFGVEQGVDLIFASLIRHPIAVRKIREVMGEAGSNIKIIAKIESQHGVENAEGIIEVADGIMVARGDLGIEIPPQKVFLAQKMLSAKCNLAGKPVICATQMLESMTQNPRPTRAECSDVANAVLDGVDCVMLSGETARGRHPIEALRMMHWLCKEAESAFFYSMYFDELTLHSKKQTDITETIALSAVSAVIASQAAAIILLTHTGESAQKCSKYKPPVPIITVTRSHRIARQLHLFRSVFPVCYTGEEEDWNESVEKRIQFGMQQGVKRDILQPGDSVVVVKGWRRGAGHTNTIRIMVVPHY